MPPRNRFGPIGQTRKSYACAHICAAVTVNESAGPHPYLPSISQLQTFAKLQSPRVSVCVAGMSPEFHQWTEDGAATALFLRMVDGFCLREGSRVPEKGLEEMPGGWAAGGGEGRRSLQSISFPRTFADDSLKRRVCQRFGSFACVPRVFLRRFVARLLSWTGGDSGLSFRRTVMLAIMTVMLLLERGIATTIPG